VIRSCRQCGVDLAVSDASRYCLSCRTGVCKECERPFSLRAPSNPRVFCSQACYRIAWQRDIKAAAQEASVRVRHEKAIEHRVCEWLNCPTPDDLIETTKHRPQRFHPGCEMGWRQDGGRHSRRRLIVECVQCRTKVLRTPQFVRQRQQIFCTPACLRGGDVVASRSVVSSAASRKCTGRVLSLAVSIATR